MFPIKVGSTTSHLINLVHEGCMIDPETKEEVSGTYRFTLRHNSNGDKITLPQTANYILAGGYVSFPLNNYIVEKDADFAIEWLWQTTEDDGTSDYDLKSLTGKYTSDGFQHTPQALNLQTEAHVE